MDIKRYAENDVISNNSVVRTMADTFNANYLLNGITKQKVNREIRGSETECIILPQSVYPKGWIPELNNKVMVNRISTLLPMVTLLLKFKKKTEFQSGIRMYISEITFLV